MATIKKSCPRRSRTTTRVESEKKKKIRAEILTNNLKETSPSLQQDSKEDKIKEIICQGIQSNCTHALGRETKQERLHTVTVNDRIISSTTSPVHHELILYLCDVAILGRNNE